jgi:hypothetical protein
MMPLKGKKIDAEIAAINEQDGLICKAGQTRR